MRSTLVSVAMVAMMATTAGCRSYRGSPVAASAAAGEGPALPSGIATRAVLELPNGLKVLLEENHAVPVVAVQAWVHVGAADTPQGQEGLANLFPHLLLASPAANAPIKPAAGQGHPAGSPPAGGPPGSAARQLADAGARIGAWSSHEATVVHATVAAPFAPLAIDLFADMLTRPPLSDDAVERARLAARDDLRHSAADPERVAAQAALATAFAGHAYGRPLLGTTQTLAAITPGQVKTFFDTFYAPGNTTLVVVGDFDAAATRARVAAAFGGWTRRGAPGRSRPFTADLGAGPQVAVFTGEVAAPQVVVAFRLPGPRGAHADDLPAVELMAAVLGRPRGGRLETELVRNRQLVASPRSYLFTARDGGLLVVSAALGGGRAEHAVHAVRDEVVRLASERIGVDELARARTVVEGDSAARKASLDGYARKLGLSMANAGDPGFESAYLERLRAVDPAVVMDVASRLLAPANLVISVVLPEAASGPVMGGAVPLPNRRPTVPSNRSPVAAPHEARPAAERAADERAARLLPRLRAVAASQPMTAPRRGPAAAVATSARDGIEYPLPSGVRLMILRDDTAPQLSVRAVWSGGVRLEDSRLAGATSLLGRLLPRLTKSRGADVLDAQLADVGGSLDAAAGMDSLTLRGDFLAAHWERGLELLVDCVRNPRFSDAEIERERRVLLAALRSREDDPTELALRLFQATLFGRHPYGHGLLGTSDSLAALNGRRLLDHYRRHYGTRGLTLVVLGPVDPDRVATKVQALFGDLPPDPGEAHLPPARLAGPPSPAAPSAPAPLPRPAQPNAQPESAAQAQSAQAQSAHAQSQKREVFQFIDKAQARLVIGFPGVTLRDPDRFPLEVLAQILGGPGGRLHAPGLRDQGILAGQAGAVSQESVDGGYFATFVATRPEALEAAVPALRAELARVVEGGVTGDEVLRARQLLMGARALTLDRRGAVATALALNAALGGPGASPRSYRRDVAELGKVTAADVARVARAVLDSSREVLAVVRPRDGERPERAGGRGATDGAAAASAAAGARPGGGPPSKVLPGATARYTSR